MTEGFSNPVLGGGGALIRPSAHSPNYAAGVSGWTINKDGSAEFNSLVIRGTFNGTNYIINNSGAFFYAGVPAANNLITSIASNSGADAFGNTYIPGVCTYDTNGNTGTIGYIQMFQQSIVIGGVNGGVFQSNQDGGNFSGNSSEMNIVSAKDVSNPTNTADQVWEIITSGKSGATTGGANVPQHSVADVLGTSPVDFRISGTLIATDVNRVSYTWQAPAYNTNWATSSTFNGSTANQGLRFRKAGQDDVLIEGCFKAGAVAPGAVVCTMPAGYRPSANKWIFASRNNGGAISFFMIQVTTGGNLNVVATVGGGIAINNEYEVQPVYVPLGTVP